MKKLFQSDFAKNTLWVSGGTAISQLITVLASVAITRIYSDEDFGVFTLYVGILSFLLTVACLKLELAIPITKNKGETINLTILNLIILISWCITTLSVFILFGDHISLLLKAPEIKNYLLLVPLGLFFGGLYGIGYQWALKTKAFPLVSRTKIAQGVGLSSGKISIGLIKASPFGLIVGHIIGKSAGVYSLIKAYHKENKNHYQLTSKKRIFWALKRFQKFPILNLPAQLLSVAGQRLPVFIIPVMYGLDNLGQFGFSEMIVSLPVLLIGAAVGDVFYAEVAENGTKNPKKILHLSNKLILKLALIGAIPMLVLLFLGPFLFAFIFGENWRLAGETAQVLGVLSFFRLVFTPVSRVFEVYEKHVTLLILNISRVLTIFLTFGLSHFLGLDYFYSIILYTVGMSLIYVLMFIFAQNIVKNKIKHS